MDGVRVKITSRLDSATHGALRPGDIVATDAETARHFVDECKAGEYVGVDAAAPGSDRTAETPLDENNEPQHKDAAHRAKRK